MRALLVVIVSSIVGAPAWAAGPRLFFNIPAGDALKTLQEYYSQSKIEMLYLTDKVRGTRTNAVVGNLEASKALELMLEGTGLDYSFEGDFSFVSINPRALPQGTAEPVELVTASSRMESREQAEQMRYTFGSEQDLEEVVVTGTLIRGVLDIMSPLEFVTKREMKKASYATVQDALQALSVTAGSSISEDFGGVGNFARGVAVNLRGLGSGATLVLVNGHRQPYSGIEGDFVDVSNIPWSAVERIEVLPDGASALYGSDAIAGVVNIIMRKDFEGAEAQVRYGGASGGAEEKLISQLFGADWSSGDLLISYQYSERTGLAAADRSFAANADKTRFGGSDFRTYRSNPGNILDPRTLVPSFALPSGQDGTSLAAADLLSDSINLENRYAPVELLPDRRMHSVFFSGTQKLGDRFEFFGESRFNKRDIEQSLFATDQLLMVPSTNPFYVNPYPGIPFVVVAYSFLDDLGPLANTADVQSYAGTFGVKTDLGDSWRLTLSGTYGREKVGYWGANRLSQPALAAALADPNPETAFNPFGSGAHTNSATVEAIRATRHEHALSTLSAASFVADGTVVEWAKGSAKLAVGGEWRREQLARGADLLSTGQFERTVESAYAEFSVPLVGDADDPRAVPRLELSLAARHERYSDFGTTSNPKIGLRWAPTDSLKLRTSWGTSFKAPKLVDVYDSSRNLAGLASLRDPQSAAGSSIALVKQGNNPNLNEETAKTWTVGVDFAPQALPGLGVSLTYYSITYDDRVLFPGPASPFDILLQENKWTEVVHRNPTTAEINAICESPEFTGSVVQCKTAPVAAIVDLRVRNLAETRVRGLDFKLNHGFRTGAGRFDFGLNGSYVMSFRQALSSTSPMTDVVDTVGNPLSLRVTGTVDWYQRGWDSPGFGTNLTLEHIGGYKDVEGTLSRSVGAFTAVDLRASYRTAARAGILSEVEFGLNASNIFDAAPPFVNLETGYDMLNSEPYGRVVSFNIQKRW